MRSLFSIKLFAILFFFVFSSHAYSGVSLSGTTTSSTTGNYGIYWSTSDPTVGFKLYENGTQIASPNSSARSYNFSGKAAGTYQYQIVLCYYSGCNTQSNIRTVTVTSVPTNSAPVISQGSSHSISTNEDTHKTITFTASDADGDSLTWSTQSQASQGTVYQYSAGGFGYTPSSNYSGSDSFVVRVSDGALTDSITINVTVYAVADAPIISQGSSTSIVTDENINKSFTLSATDVDSSTLTWSVQSQGSKGSASASGTGTSKSITYNPNSNATGSDSFVIRVSDGAKTDSITVNVTINGVNYAPVISQGGSELLSTNENTAKNITLTASDIDDDSLTWSIQTQASNGSVIHNGDGDFEYTPESNYSGDDSFVVRVSDGVLTDDITIIVTVIAGDIETVNLNASSDTSTTGDIELSWSTTADWDSVNIYENDVKLDPAATSSPHLLTERANGTYEYYVELCNGAVCNVLSNTITVSVTINDGIDVITPVIVTYQYDALGRLKEVTDPKNGNRNYTYDKAGNRITAGNTGAGN